MVVFAIITFLCDRKKLGAQQRCYEFSFIIPPFFLAVLDWPRSSSSTMILSSWLIILEISAAEDVAMTDPDPQALMDWTQRRLLFVQNQNERERFFSPKKKNPLSVCQSVRVVVGSRFSFLPVKPAAAPPRAFFPIGAHPGMLLFSFDYISDKVYPFLRKTRK